MGAARSILGKIRAMVLRPAARETYASGIARSETESEITFEEDFTRGEKIMDFIRPFFATPNLKGWLVAILTTSALVFLSYRVGNCNGQSTGFPEGYKKGYDDGRTDCPKPTKIPDYVEKWRKK